MATAQDTYDQYMGNIHPRNKHVVARRLALAAMGQVRFYLHITLAKSI